VHRKRRTLALLVLAALPFSACAKVAEEEATGPEPARVVQVKGTNQSRLVLTKKAAERVGITTAPVGEITGPGGDGVRKVVDYSALIYDADGNAFVYTNPEPLTFVRQPVTVDVIEGDRVVFSDGPSAGTAVVTVGVPELFGIDAGVGGNE
jgi:hypothetical protein